MVQAYDPLNYDNLARSVVHALLDTTATGLPPNEAFAGSGVYALYYNGALPFYTAVASKDLKTPIYVGKAVPSGARKGAKSRKAEGTTELHRRLRQHAESIEQTDNLDVREFCCRFLVVQDVWITLAERFLLDHFQPVWNTVVDGFGNHNPGRGRSSMRRPRWDMVHPGRPWALALKAEETAEEIIALLPSRT